LSIPAVVIAPDEKQAEQFADDYRFFNDDEADRPLCFFSSHVLPYKFHTRRAETAGERIAALYKLATDNVPPMIITTPAAAMQRIIPKAVLCDFAELVMAGEEVGLDDFLAKLTAGGYERTVIVESPGDYCVRGGIVDVFSPLYADPLRIEFFGEQVDSLRFFSAVNQLTTVKTVEAVILPAGEAVLPADRMDAFSANIRKRGAEMDLPVTKIRAALERIRNNREPGDIEGLVPLLYPEPATLFEYLPAGVLPVVLDPPEVEAATAKTWESAYTGYNAAVKGGKIAMPPETLYLSPADFRKTTTRGRPLSFRDYPVFSETEASAQTVSFSTETNQGIRESLKGRKSDENLFRPLAEWFQYRLKDRLTTVAVATGKNQAQRLETLLTPYGVRLDRIETFIEAEKHAPEVREGNKKGFLCLGRVSGGFVWPAAGLAVVTAAEIFGMKRALPKPPPPKVKTELLNLGDLKTGDFVVHVEHGIGCYEGLIKLTTDAVTGDFLQIAYRDQDRLYLPVDRMGMIQKYVGVEGYTPTPDKMGGKTWERTKGKIKKSAEKIAGELLKLYAERKAAGGVSYEVNDADLSTFEEGFAFEETPDQKRTIEDVLSDMQADTPMDRLVCGDVGYGKTEVALRASFLAVNEGKQSAVLVPTTVLAEQHYATFTERFSNIPVNIACLNRFRPPREQRRIVADAAAGKIDILIGTHRLLQKDVSFRDLGLLIVDEEQRFGVKQKEILKTLRKSVDVLALTATPIPRTLHLSMSGIRDISVISTPPEHRRPIETFVIEYDEAIIADAIRKEIDRGGQIFFVHNNIHSIQKTADRLQELVPRGRFAVAHGRMAEDALEKTMITFLQREIDVLVCTTIIESGLDIPSANTIIVNRADTFGLSQIYQLRGRVGRAREQAYAYLVIQNESTMTRDARRRLKVLMEHSDLGSGFQIALNDMQIRGGGTILGAAQSGHVAAVGYEMFLQLLENAVAELKGEPVIEPLDPEIHIPMSAYLPESYIPDIDQRLGAYRRLVRMHSIKEISAFKAELIDRFGPLPETGANLLLKIMLRVLAVRAGVARLDLTEQGLSMRFSAAHVKHPERLIALVFQGKDRFFLTPDEVLKAPFTAKTPGGLLALAKNRLQEVAQHVN
jgi:transcription-repair coupling factor (superfamily II helicase)